MNIVFWILVILTAIILWLLGSPLFNKIGEFAINIFNKIINNITK